MKGTPCASTAIRSSACVTLATVIIGNIHGDHAGATVKGTVEIVSKNSGQLSAQTG